MPSIDDNPALYIIIIVMSIWGPYAFFWLRKRLTERPTLPVVPTLPVEPEERECNPNCRCVVIPVAFFDASDTTPDQANTYCLACWLEWISMPWRDYFAPEGIAVFCERHAYLTLARALSAQQQQRETGERYL